MSKYQLTKYAHIADLRKNDMNMIQHISLRRRRYCSKTMTSLCQMVWVFLFEKKSSDVCESSVTDNITNTKLEYLPE